MNYKFLNKCHVIINKTAETMNVFSSRASKHNKKLDVKETLILILCQTFRKNFDVFRNPIICLFLWIRVYFFPRFEIIFTKIK